MHSTTPINHPYIHKLGQINYVAGDNTYMQQAKSLAVSHSLDKNMPNASVLVKDDQIIGWGANGSDYHDKHGCRRVELNIPTGQGYELCEGCSQKNHSEPKAIVAALKNSSDLKGSELYLWGHWWCCEPCWQKLIDNHVHTVNLLEDSDVLFNKTVVGNIVGKQFIA